MGMNTKRSRFHLPLAVLTPCIGLVILSGCGQLGSTESTTTSQPAGHYFSRGLAAMQSANAYHMVGIRAAQNWRIDLTVQSGRVITEELSTAEGNLSYIDSHGARYLKAGAAFLASNAVIAEHLAGQWIGLNGTFPPSIDDPANLSKTADCVLGRHGSATVKGAATIAGVPTVEVDDVGDVPGSFPGKFYFAVATGDLVQVIATGPVHPGGMDAICAGGLSLNPGSAAEMGTYLFDGWRSHFVATAPSSAINLDDAPFCGSPLGQQLSQAAQQYLAASFEWNRAIVVVAASCGCNSNATYSEFRAAVLQEVAANELYAVAMGRLAVTGKALADAQALVADTQAEDQVFRAAAATPGFATYNAYTNAIGQARNRQGAAALTLRSDLGVGKSTCSYVIP
jgi:hypothetical protein